MLDFRPDDCHQNIDNAWINTFSGKVFFPLNPSAEDLSVEDIAHSLSMQCRWNGHTKRFYSVARHSVLVMQLVSDRAAPYALMHDATEAYLTDIPRPIKPHLGGYAAFESALEAQIIRRYNIDFDPEIKAEVKKADADMLVFEREHLIRKAPRTWGYEGYDCRHVSDKYSPLILGGNPEQDFELFMTAARSLNIKD